jgi:hypothetical protein
MDTSTMPSVPSPLTFDNWNKHAKNANIKDAKGAHYKSGRIFDKTRQQIRHNTRKMRVLSCRGFQRARYVPTKTTKRPLLERRYSVDVSTKDWDKDSKSYDFNEDAPCSHKGSLSPDRTCTCVNVASDFSQHDQCIEAPTTPQRYEEDDPTTQQTPVVSLPTPLRHQHLNVWAAKNPPHDTGQYLTLGDGILKNEYFNFILAVNGSEAWMDDSSFNMALEALRRIEDCDAHSIDVVNTNISQIFYFAFACGDWNSITYDAYRERLKDKRWIFVPINDGVGGDADSYASGSHWSLLVMDRVHKFGLYYDSMAYMNSTRYKSWHAKSQRACCGSWARTSTTGHGCHKRTVPTSGVTTNVHWTVALAAHLFGRWLAS